MIIFSVGSFSFNAENIFRRTFVIFKMELPRSGRISRMTGVVILLLTITAVGASSMVLRLLSYSSFSGIFAIRLSFLL